MSEVRLRIDVSLHDKTIGGFAGGVCAYSCLRPRVSVTSLSV